MKWVIWVIHAYLQHGNLKKTLLKKWIFIYVYTWSYMYIHIYGTTMKKHENIQMRRPIPLLNHAFISRNLWHLSTVEDNNHGGMAAKRPTLPIRWHLFFDGTILIALFHIFLRRKTQKKTPPPSETRNCTIWFIGLPIDFPIPLLNKVYWSKVLLKQPSVNLSIFDTTPVDT